METESWKETKSATAVFPRIAGTRCTPITAATSRNPQSTARGRKMPPAGCVCVSIFIEPIF